MNRKGLTLLEIIVAMACLGLIIGTMYQIFKTTTMYTVSGITNVRAQEETKQITETIKQIISTSTYVEILDEAPDVKDNNYKYVYSKDGVVYYYDGYEENTIDVSDKMNNTITFEKIGEGSILKYRIVSEFNEVRGDYSTSINLRNLDDYIVDSSTTGMRNCIKFKNQRDIAVITNFTLRESYNNAQGITEDIKGNISNKTITVNVPSDVDVTSLMPSVKFFGESVYFSDNGELTDSYVKEQIANDNAEEESSNYNLSEVLNGGKDFSETKYYYVVSGDLVVKYTVIVKMSQPETGIKIVQTDSEEIIWYNKNFVAELEAPQSGTYYWYVEGITEAIYTSTENVLPVQTLITYDTNNGDLKKYAVGNANQYEDVMRFITVKFVPNTITGGNPLPVSTGGILASPVFVYTEPYDFYSKVATDVWIQTIQNPTDSWLVGVDTVETYKQLYKKSTGKDYDYGSTYVNNNDNLYYDDKPEFIKVLYSVDPSTLVFKPYVLSMDSQATLSGDKGYAKTIFGVDLDYYKTNIEDSVISDLDTYNIKVGFAATSLNTINGNDITLKERNNLYRASIGVFNAREIYKTYSNLDVDALKGFRAVTGAKIRGNIGSNPQVGMKIMNYSDAAENNIMNIDTKPSKLLEQYISNGVLQSMSQYAKPNTFTLELQTQRQNNEDNSIIYYGKLYNENAVSGQNAVPVGYVTFKEDLNNGTSGDGEAMGISQTTYSETELVFGDNYNAMNKEDLVDNSDDVLGKYKTITKGNFISVGTSGDGINATSIKCASYITGMSIEDGFEALNVTNATVLGHTTVTGMGENIKNATILELEFDKPIRSGYDYRLYENDTVTVANIDTGITNILKSNIGKEIKVRILEKAERRPSKNQTDLTTPNMNVDGINIKNSSGVRYNVIKNNSTGVQYAYKTGENKIVVLVDKPLTAGNIYDISFTRGAVRAMIGGDVKIKPTTVEGKPFAFDDDTSFDLEEDILVNGGIIDKTTDEGFGHLGEDYALWGNNQYYRTSGTSTAKMPNGNYNTLIDNFNIEATTIKKVGFKQGGSGGANRFEAYGLFNESNGNGYVMTITDITHYAEENKVEVAGKSQLGILSIRNRAIFGPAGNGINGPDFTYMDDYYIGGMDNRVYFNREKDKLYTFISKFADNSITLQVLNQSGNPIELINIKGELVGTSYTITIPTSQVMNDKFDTVLMQSGAEYTYFLPGGNFVIYK